MNSEVEGYFTARVNQNIYDSATHTRLLVPQGSTIIGHDNSSQLVYGNERMDTTSLTLAAIRRHGRRPGACPRDR